MWPRFGHRRSQSCGQKRNIYLTLSSWIVLHQVRVVSGSLAGRLDVVHRSLSESGETNAAPAVTILITVLLGLVNSLPTRPDYYFKQFSPSLLTTWYWVKVLSRLMSLIVMVVSYVLAVVLLFQGESQTESDIIVLALLLWIGRDELNANVQFLLSIQNHVALKEGIMQPYTRDRSAEYYEKLAPQQRMKGARGGLQVRVWRRPCSASVRFDYGFVIPLHSHSCIPGEEILFSRARTYVLDYEPRELVRDAVRHLDRHLDKLSLIVVQTQLLSDAVRGLALERKEPTESYRQGGIRQKIKRVELTLGYTENEDLDWIQEWWYNNPPAKWKLLPEGVSYGKNLWEIERLETPPSHRTKGENFRYTRTPVIQHL
mmetsp:Transcript_35164/g.85999  ORF Transcript_35164/g.85999 Transcript_35164/m.85999 type:complete len:372 (-) Transcript_35164:87-1202(-)|eukprot:CAMPEP_0198349010 /NCGR_PEP_ID=MMETSP1450-20131203/92159_1 /TAXON_ID=753684 ORGANISM="Madagascaria erythrocladiodes, Strain CCMP3234" /NCGR_SAMPLE_ID=MMETSP1450 /ASSEMBLY_ACC=CAM_ASM_001115 /LENGTH=371 /DNA_ID=CAMNT_0044054657 /DNA_START=129 /DNA_END=1244 /DNA_ORIENTATION=-